VVLDGDRPCCVVEVKLAINGRGAWALNSAMKDTVRGAERGEHSTAALRLLYEALDATADEIVDEAWERLAGARPKQEKGD
jgi:hypothetical protein